MMVVHPPLCEAPFPQCNQATPIMGNNWFAQEQLMQMEEAQLHPNRILRRGSHPAESELEYT